MSDNNLDIRARLTGVNELSPVLKKVIADLQKFEGVAKRVNIQFGGMGRSGMGALDGFNRVAKAATDQMRGMTNLARTAARSYSTDWAKANAQRLSDARRTYASLERLESSYLRQIERRAAVERRASSGRSYSGGVGRLPAPNIRTIAAGAVITGAGAASALRKRMEVQAAEVRAQMFGDLDKGEVGKLRRDYADKAGIRYGIGSSKVIDTVVEGLKAGVAKQFAGEFADLALKAQAGLDVDPEAVAKLLGRLSSQMPWSTDRFSKILNAVAVANNATAADGNEIIEAMRRSLAALATTKMIPEQLAAIDATGISLGVQPHKMGTFASFLTSQIAGADSARGQQASDLNSAANALGFDGRSGMAKTMRERPMEAIQQILDNLAKMPERLRTKVAKQIGGREWMDEFLTLVLGRDKLKDVVRDVENKPGFLDKSALQKIRSMQGRWASISAALGLVWEKVGAGLEGWFDQASDSIINLADSFNFDSIKEHFAALIDGAREGFGLKDWGDVVKSMADNFDAGTVAKWREFGRGFAEGIREFANGLKTAFSALGFLAGKNPADAREMGDLVAKLTGLTVALATLSPLLSVLTALTLGLTGIGNALALIGGSAAAVALLSMFAVRNQNAGVPDANVKQPGETTSEWRERQKARRNRLYHKSSFTGSTDFSGMRRANDLSDDLTKFTGKVERAAFINSGTMGGLQYASIGGASGGSGSGGLGGRSYIGGVPSLLKSTPGSALPDFGVGRSGSIIRTIRGRVDAITGADKVPTIGGSLDTMTGQGLSGNKYLAARRARFADEIKNDPTLRMHLAAIQATEGTSGGGVIESLMNRADMEGKTLRQMIGMDANGVRHLGTKGYLKGKPDSFYGPIRRGEIYGAIRRLQNNPKEFAKYDALTNRALAGSHIIGGYTDQGLPTDPNGSRRTGIPGFKINPKDGNEFTDWVGPGGRQKSINYRHHIEKGIAGSSDSPIASVPTPTDVIKNVPPPSSVRLGPGAGDARSVPGNVAININGSSHDPEALATLVQRRIDESMNWRTHDTASEYT
ncbi:TP901 family phage tail tape measure protein [Bradyrhizobium ottawaense]|uniref:phage tail tape measure protein n=1 Tax=Bradyrhizobium ottawaense TaxID=931866 RepID=UPI00351483B7